MNENKITDNDISLELLEENYFEKKYSNNNNNTSSIVNSATPFYINIISSMIMFYEAIFNLINVILNNTSLGELICILYIKYRFEFKDIIYKYNLNQHPYKLLDDSYLKLVDDKHEEYKNKMLLYMNNTYTSILANNKDYISKRKKDIEKMIEEINLDV